MGRLPLNKRLPLNYFNFFLIDLSALATQNGYWIQVTRVFSVVLDLEVDF